LPDDACKMQICALIQAGDNIWKTALQSLCLSRLRQSCCRSARAPLARRVNRVFRAFKVKKVKKATRVTPENRGKTAPTGFPSPGKAPYIKARKIRNFTGFTTTLMTEKLTSMTEKAGRFWPRTEKQARRGQKVKSGKKATACIWLHSTPTAALFQAEKK